MEARRNRRIGFLTHGEKSSAAEINPLNDRQPLPQSAWCAACTPVGKDPKFAWGNTYLAICVVGSSLRDIEPKAKASETSSLRRKRVPR